MDITLHFAPGTCARVPLIALEEIGQPFSTELVSFIAGDHRSPTYLALNPKGKVPTLIVDNVALTENVAIQIWLAEQFPEAGLLPRPRDAMERAHLIADLAFCASTMHGIVTRLRLPRNFCDTDTDRVWQQAAAAMAPNFALIDARLARGWWYGGQWSAMDAYLYWIWFRVTGSDFDASAYPHYARHAADMEERPAVQRALAREREAYASLEQRGLAVSFAR